MANEQTESGYNPIAQALRGFAIGVADGAAASSHPSGRMFGAAMQGAMAPVYEAQALDLERARAEADQRDYQSMSDPFALNAADEFEMVEPEATDFLKQFVAMSHKGFRNQSGSDPEIRGSNITLKATLQDAAQAQGVPGTLKF